MSGWLKRLGIVAAIGVAIGACGDDSTPQGGTGGNAGTVSDGGSGGTAGEPGFGGTGGTPGTGGTGATGGSTGGTGGGFHGSGSCDEPFDFRLLAGTGFNSTARYEGVLSGESASMQGSCGGGKAVVFQYRPPDLGRLNVAVTSRNNQLVLFTRTTCDDSSTELSCGTPGDSREIRGVDPDVPVYLVVGGPEPLTDGNYVLSVSFSPYGKEGDTCGSTGTFKASDCAPGLWCDQSGSGRCVVNVPPTIERVSALRGGKLETDLIVEINGVDAFRHTTVTELRALDASGQPVIAFGKRGSLEEVEFDTQTIVSEKSENPGERVRMLLVVPDFFARTPNVSRLRVVLIDQVNGRSEPVMVDVKPQPAVSAGAVCDPDWMSNRCAGPLVCVSGRCS